MGICFENCLASHIILPSLPTAMEIRRSEMSWEISLSMAVGSRLGIIIPYVGSWSFLPTRPRERQRLLEN